MQIALKIKSPEWNKQTDRLTDRLADRQTDRLTLNFINIDRYRNNNLYTIYNVLQYFNQIPHVDMRSLID